MDNNEEVHYISYDRFSYPKKHIIQHKYTGIDGSVVNTMKQSKNSPGLAMASPSSQYSSSPSKIFHEKREDNIGYKKISMEDYKQAYQKQRYYKQNTDFQKQKAYRILDYKKPNNSELSNSIRKMVPRDPRGDITSSMANLTLNERKGQRKIRNGDIYNNDSPKSSDSSKSNGQKRIDNIVDYYNYDGINVDDDREHLYRDNDINNKKAAKYNNNNNNNNNNQYQSPTMSHSNLSVTSNNNQYQSPTMSHSNLSVTSSNNGYNGPLFQNPNYKKFNDEGIDISVGEILVYGLKAMLKSKVPLCYFLHTLIEDYCCENLFFYLEIEQYKIFLFEDEKSQLKAAQYIYITYLDSSSKIEVNIDEKIRKDIFNQLKARKCNLSTVFDKASEAVFNLMESTFAKFNRSNIKQQMIDELDNTNFYSEEHKINAIRVLTSYLDKRKRELEVDEEIMMINAANQGIDLREGMPMSPGQMLHYTNVQRNKLINALTHEFIRAFLELDFDDESILGEVCVFRPPIQYIQNINEDPLKHLSSSPNSKRFQLQDIQISIITDEKGHQYQIIVTPPVPIASFHLEGYENVNSRKSSPNPLKKLIKSVKLGH